MFNDFSIFFVNVRDIMFLLLCLFSMFDWVKCDIVIILEYKFKLNNVLYLDLIYFDYKIYIWIEFIDIFIYCLYFLGKGGIVIMYKKEFEFFICKIIDFDFLCIIWLDIKWLYDCFWCFDCIWYLFFIW